MIYELNNLRINSDVYLPLMEFAGAYDIKYYDIKICKSDKIDVPQKYIWCNKKGNNILVYGLENYIIVDYQKTNIRLKISSETIYYNNAINANIVMPIITIGISTILNMLGYSPLHAAGFVRYNNATLITGVSGAGKSSLLAKIIDKGAGTFLCDDVIPIKIVNDLVYTQGFNGFMKQWKYNIDNSIWLHSYNWTKIENNIEKYYALCEYPTPSMTPVISNIFVLNPIEQGGTQTVILKITNPIDKYKLIMRAFYCASYLKNHQSFYYNTKNALAFIESVSIFKVNYTCETLMENIVLTILDCITKQYYEKGYIVNET